MGRTSRRAIQRSSRASDEALLEGLNPAQREAVLHGEGPLLVIAGAGTGKTRTLASRVASLIQRGVCPDRILLLTFTRRAAAEMLQRAGRACGEQAVARVWGGTFHAVANRLLRIYGQVLNLSPDFTILDQSDAADLMNLVRSELGLSSKERRLPRKETLLSIYSRMVNAQESLQKILAIYFPSHSDDKDDIARVFDGYVDRKRQQHVLDYDDLLLNWCSLLEQPSAGPAVADRFDHILVDEYQDTNALQAEILHGMRRRNKNIMVVGDDAQSIYSFRAATVRNILDFPDQFPGTRIVALEQNYRSTKPILAASNAVMEDASERYTKELWSERSAVQRPVLFTCRDESGQCDEVCASILGHLEQGVPLYRQAVLFRAGHHSARLEVELARRKIPFRKYGGLKFVEAAHVKDVVALLRILENPFDELSWFRILQRLSGIGPRTARRIIAVLGVREGASPVTPTGGERASLPSPFRQLLQNPPRVPAAAGEDFARLRGLLAECLGARAERPADANRDSIPVGRKEPPLPAQVERIRDFFDPIFEQAYDKAAARLRDIDQLIQIAAAYRSRRRLVADLTLDPPDSASDFAGPPFLEEDYLILSTIHSAKGCEWDIVHIIHAADGYIPSDMALEDEGGEDEERRLFYVAMTRARDRLYVYYPHRFYKQRFGHKDGHGLAQLTRFVTPRVRSLFEVRSAYFPAEEEENGSDIYSSDPDARLKRLWR